MGVGGWMLLSLVVSHQVPQVRANARSDILVTDCRGVRLIARFGVRNDRNVPRARGVYQARASAHGRNSGGSEAALDEVARLRFGEARRGPGGEAHFICTHNSRRSQLAAAVGRGRRCAFRHRWCSDVFRGHRSDGVQPARGSSRRASRFPCRQSRWREPPLPVSVLPTRDPSSNASRRPTTIPSTRARASPRS